MEASSLLEPISSCDRTPAANPVRSLATGLSGLRPNLYHAWAPVMSLFAVTAWSTILRAGRKANARTFHVFHTKYLGLAWNHHLHRPIRAICGLESSDL